MKNPYGRRHRMVRAVVLARDGWRCRCEGDCGGHIGRCDAFATEADHIMALADGGARYDPANERASCGPCNRRRGHQVQRRRARAARIGSRALPW